MAASRPRPGWRTPLGLTAVCLVGLIVALAIFAPLIWGQAASATDIDNLLAPPSGAHWAGTDNLGRDLFARVMVATRLSVVATLEATAIGVVAGIILGSAPFLLGKVVGRAVVWFIGIAVAFPGLLLALFFAVIFGTGVNSAALALGLASAPGFARLCHTLVAGVLNRDYVAAASIGGVGRVRILLRHILPNIGEPLVVNATIGAGSILLSFAGLSFLGLGVQPPQYDWGRLLNECLQSIYVHPLASLTPGLAVIVAGLAFNLTGESIAHALGVTSLGDLGWRGQLRRRLERPSAQPTATATAATVLAVKGLSVSFPAGDRLISPVRAVSFDIAAGEAVGLVGESGSGKSLTAMAVAQLIEQPGQVSADALWFAGADLLDGGSHRHLLGTSLAVIFQDPMTSLNPTMRVGAQLAELARVHGGASRAQAKARAVERLGAVQIDHPAHRARQYPHELSGGMRQRAMIGLGVMLTPKLIIADEPTTALDVSVQRQVLELLAGIRAADGVSLLLISHDVSVIAEVCDRTMVMYAGKIVEDLPTSQLSRANHPYTRALVAAVPTMRTDLTAPLPTIPGRPPEPGDITGCAFAPRCPLVTRRCLDEDPELTGFDGARVACWHAGEVALTPPRDAVTQTFNVGPVVVHLILGTIMTTAPARVSVQPVEAVA